MWSQALRRIVHAEERSQEERRRKQLLQAAAAGSSASNAALASPGQPVEAEESKTEDKESAGQNDAATAEPVEEDEDYVQKHILSDPTWGWTLLEDTQQANCLALNASSTLLAVGERDGRVTIWDNTTIRVLTRELDPTLIALPVDETTADTAKGSEQDKASANAKTSTVDEGSVENDDGSVEDDEDVRTEDNVSAEEDVATATEEEEDHESEETKTEDELDVSGGGVTMTLSDLRAVKSSLKVVSQCEWSCDSRSLFVACEEKSTRRARLCVWDVEAATLVSAFRFDGAINALSAHPHDPKLVIVSYNNSRPVLLDVRSGDRTELVNVPLDNSQYTQPPVPANSRYAALFCCARYGRSGKRVYCITSKSTLAVLDASSLACLDSAELTVLIQFVDVSMNGSETSLLVTSSKGIHEFDMDDGATDAAPEADHALKLKEVAVHSTGAVRAPWAVCRFSGDEKFVVGTPVVRHLHVGENGLYTWHRGSVFGRTTAQHNVGVKDGVLALAWDHSRDSVLAVSTGGALHVRGEMFTTTFPGAMYPAGFRLINDNERHLAVFDDDAEERKRELEKLAEAARHAPVDVFTVQSPDVEFPDEAAQSETKKLDDLRFLPAIPIAYYHRRHLHLVQGASYNEEKHFGLGQSVFEPLKGALGKSKSAKSKRKAAMNGGGHKKKRRR